SSSAGSYWLCGVEHDFRSGSIFDRLRLQQIRIDRQAAQALAGGGENRIGHCSTDNGCRSFTNATWSFRVLNQVCLHHRHLVDTHRQIAVEIALLDASILESD